MHGSNEFNKLQRDMSKRDAVLSFRCSAPNSVRVSETIDGKSIHHQEVERTPGVVTELEQRYMFFARQADVARNQIMRGQSCVFNVYFRQP
jgi:hypothetical protein